MLKKWHAKAIVQKVISFLPGRHKINYWFQKNITKGVILSDEYFFDRLEHAQKHVAWFEKMNMNFSESRSMELGSGWYPVVPIYMFLKGMGSIYTLDISPLSDAVKLRQTLERYKSYIESLEGEHTFKAERIETLLSLIQDENLDHQQMLDKLHITYLIADARNISTMESDSIHMIHSNNTFEHIYPAILKDILIEFKRVLHPKGHMSHFVDMSDHFAHADPSISIYNFLTFSKNTWEILIDNSVQPQNRYRYPQYQAMYEDLQIEIQESETRPGNVNIIKSLKISKEFSTFTPESLAISHCYLFT
jgi:ubiquinone/menaquinone biosynthesis C-methylase UbiE